MISLNILNDEYEARKFIRMTFFNELFRKLKRTSELEINVWGGYQQFPYATRWVPGNFSLADNTVNFLSQVTTLKDEDLVILLENDVYPCSQFIEYILYLEEKVNEINTMRSGFNSHFKLVEYFKDFVQEGEAIWLRVPTASFWFAQCLWAPAFLWKEFHQYIKKFGFTSFSKATSVQLDSSIQVFLKSTGREFVLVAVPNVVAHIGEVSAIYPNANLTQESPSWKSSRQTFCFVEDPLGFIKTRRFLENSTVDITRLRQDDNG